MSINRNAKFEIRPCEIALAAGKSNQSPLRAWEENSQTLEGTDTAEESVDSSLEHNRRNVCKYIPYLVPCHSPIVLQREADRDHHLVQRVV